jgi:hypothetical protein
MNKPHDTRFEGEQFLLSFMSEIPKCDPLPNSSSSPGGGTETKDSDPSPSDLEIQLELFDDYKNEHRLTPHPVSHR